MLCICHATSTIYSIGLLYKISRTGHRSISRMSSRTGSTNKAVSGQEKLCAKFQVVEVINLELVSFDFRQPSLDHSRMLHTLGFKTQPTYLMEDLKVTDIRAIPRFRLYRNLIKLFREDFFTNGGHQLLLKLISGCLQADGHPMSRVITTTAKRKTETTTRSNTYRLK